MDEITAKVDKLLSGIMDLAYEEPDSASEFILALISKLAIMSLFYQATYQMKHQIDKSIRIFQKPSSNSNVSINPTVEAMLYNILRDKEK
jgi:hypothetical protein